MGFATARAAVQDPPRAADRPRGRAPARARRGPAVGPPTRRGASPCHSGRLPRRFAQRAFAADTLWGVAALLWIGSGLWRYLAGTEKSTEYYNRNHFFLAKMTLLAAILLLELWPMVKLVRGRTALRRGASAEAVVTPAIARRIAVVSDVQAAISSSWCSSRPRWPAGWVRRRAADGRLLSRGGCSARFPRRPTL
jgi:uncharacterized membrane protein